MVVQSSPGGRLTRDVQRESAGASEFRVVVNQTPREGVSRTDVV